MKKIIDEFRKFALKGNVIDLAIGIMIGSAFNQIVTSIVNDIVSPLLAAVVGGLNFDDYKVILEPATRDDTGQVLKEAVSMNYGAFFQVLLNFLLVAVILFVAVKIINRARAKKPEPKTVTPAELVLLTEIRDLLKRK
ncbi:large conductance mechanosensitive channel protein MscL [Candidatus Gracilibacteria bacterium]|nr:large conductance mechanosensitive channel protein MscL [Candidatus Gracilibacteria bacterium]